MKRFGHRHACSSKLRHYRGASALALAGSLGLTGPAFSQEAPTPVPAQAENTPDADQNGEIVVNGFRSSLDQAINLKRNSTSMVDAIVAEDIAKFPDQNLAESLQRIPGITIERQGGEGRRISVRGLGAQFTSVRLNGLQTIAAAADNTSRSFDFYMFASELFNSLVVHKSAEASVDEGSLGAVVDLNTGNPLAGATGLTGALNAQASYNTNLEKTLPRVAGILSYKSPSGTWGANVSVAYSKTHAFELGHDSVRWSQSAFDSVKGVPCFTAPNRGGSYVSSAGCDEAALAFHARIPRYVQDERYRERIGVTSSFQFAPTESTKISIDGLYSRLNELEDFRTAEVLFRGNERAVDLVNYTIAPGNSLVSGIRNNTLVAGTFNDAWVRTEHYEREMYTDFYQVSGKLEQSFGDSFRINLLAGMSHSTSDVPRETTIALDDRDAAGFSYDYTNREHPIIKFGTDPTNPANFQLAEIRDSLSTVKNGFKTVALDAQWDVTDGFKIKAGGFYRRYEFDRIGSDRNTVVCPTVSTPTPDVVLGTITCTPSTVFGPTAVYGFPVTSNLTELYTLPSQAGAPAGSTTQWVVANIPAAAAYTKLYSITPRLNIGGTRGVIEQTKGGFLQFDAKGQLLGLDYTLNAGVRYAETRQRSRGINSGTTVVVERTYGDWLPALNFSIDPSRNTTVRVAVADVMTRPELDQLTPGGSVDGFNYVVSFGNPDLQPYRATSYDIAFEWYFRRQAMFSVGAFSKDVSSFPIAATRQGTFASTGLPVSIINPSSPAATAVEGKPWTIQGFINGTGANIKGVELSLQTPLWFLPGFLKNFGVIANATFASSNAPYTVTPPAATLVNGSGGTVVNSNTAAVPLSPSSVVVGQLFNLSKRTYNGTIYYEDSKFSARVSAAYRSPFVSGLSGTGNVFEGTNEGLYIDASMSYKLTKNVTLSLEGTNLTNEARDTFSDLASNRPTTITTFGRTVTAGVRLGF